MAGKANRDHRNIWIAGDPAADLRDVSDALIALGCQVHWMGEPPHHEKVPTESMDPWLATITALARLAETRDDDSGRHLDRLQMYCKILSVQMKTMPAYQSDLSDGYIENLIQTAPLHDIGKVAIPDQILLKPTRVSAEEFKIIQRHTLVGAQTLESVLREYPWNEFIRMGIAVTRWHHEKWDGSGYPDGLGGEKIPLAARMLALADVYDALRSRRPYKEPFTHEQTCQIILNQSGKHFDPGIVSAFLAVKTRFASVCALMEDD